MNTRTKIFVEGPSDRLALECLARRLGHDLAAAGVEIVDVGGVTNFRSFLTRYGPLGERCRVAGLCDSGELRVVLGALVAAGVALAPTPESLAGLGFFVCDGELEDELLSAVGVEALLGIIARNGDMRRFRTMQRQPVYRGAPLKTQVRYIMTQKKIHYAPALIEALDLRQVPIPLSAVLDFALHS